MARRERDDRVKVRFLTHDAPYQAGEVVAFTAAAAAKLVRHAVAEYLEEAAEPDAR